MEDGATGHRTDEGPSLDRARRRRAVVAVVAAAMTLVMAAIAVAGLTTVEPDARLLVLAASVGGVGAGLGGAALVAAGRIRIGGVLLMLSIVTPTYMAAVVNLLPALLGLVLVIDSFRADGVFVDAARIRRRPSDAGLPA